MVRSQRVRWNRQWTSIHSVGEKKCKATSESRSTEDKAATHPSPSSYFDCTLDLCVHKLSVHKDNGNVLLQYRALDNKN